MIEEFVYKKFTAKTLLVIEQANAIIEEYDAQGFTLTLRQLYYQFVSRDLFANKQKNYKRLGSIMGDARLSGLVDWDAMTDRTRAAKMPYSSENVRSILASAAGWYTVDKWKGQEFRPEVWVEKEALIDVVAKACTPLQVPHFACKGYVSLSAMYEAAQRRPRMIIHLGDHDPSGIDMTRDIQSRMSLLMDGDPVEVRRIALNMVQIAEFNPPPNPAKETDSRVTGYKELYGDSSWELDALEPSYMMDIITDEINEFLDPSLWHEQEEKQREGRERLLEYADMEMEREND